MADRSILITGCSSGIGLDAARALRLRGWRVFASCRKAADCERLRKEGFESPRLDYQDETTLDSALEEVFAATGGRLDALYNNGAFGLPCAVEDLPRAALREILEANLIGPHDLARRVIPAMRKQGHGRIINCSSVLGYVPYRWRGAYVATKWAMEGLTDTLRIEMRGTPIRVVLIEPGLISTEFGRNSARNFEHWIDWENSARVDEYRSDLLKKLNGANALAKLEAPPSAVTKKLIRALEARRPRARYKVTRLAHVADVLRRALPASATDALFSRL